MRVTILKIMFLFNLTFILLMNYHQLVAKDKDVIDIKTASPKQTITVEIGSGSHVLFSTFRFSQKIWDHLSIEPTFNFLFDDDKIGKLYYANLLYRFDLKKLSIVIFGGPGYSDALSIYDNHSHWAYNFGVGSLIPIIHSLSFRLDLGMNRFYSENQEKVIDADKIKTGEGFFSEYTILIGLTYSRK